MPEFITINKEKVGLAEQKVIDLNIARLRSKFLPARTCLQSP